MKPEEYSSRKETLAGWPVTIVSYRLGTTYHVTAENNEPGAWVVKAQGQTKQAAEEKAITEATGLLAKIKQTPPPSRCTSVPGF
jgi:hypothetical protein